MQLGPLIVGIETLLEPRVARVNTFLEESIEGAGKSLIDRSNACTFVIGIVQQRPTKIVN
jgi:hypothetical protein